MASQASRNVSLSASKRGDTLPPASNHASSKRQGTCLFQDSDSERFTHLFRALDLSSTPSPSTPSSLPASRPYSSSPLPPLSLSPSPSPSSSLPPAVSSSPSSPFTHPANLLFERFEVSASVLGSGQFGSVRECRDRITGERLACKTLNHAGPTQLQTARREADVMARLAEHEGIVQLKGLFMPSPEEASKKEQQEGSVSLVMELCEGGDLFDEIVRRRRFLEAEAAEVFGQVVSAVLFCHSRGIIHRDLKPENILLSRQPCACKAHRPGSKAGSVHAKLADFGLAVELQPGKQVRGIAGSPSYMAPELALGWEYGRPADVWSLGVLLYVLLAGYPPFWGDSEEEVLASVKDGYVDLESEPWDVVSEQAKALVSALLCRDPVSRPSLEEVMDHPWMHMHQNQARSAWSCRQLTSQVTALHEEANGVA